MITATIATTTEAIKVIILGADSSIVFPPVIMLIGRLIIPAGKATRQGKLNLKEDDLIDHINALCRVISALSRYRRAGLAPSWKSWPIPI